MYGAKNEMPVNLSGLMSVVPPKHGIHRWSLFLVPPTTAPPLRSGQLRAPWHLSCSSSSTFTAHSCTANGQAPTVSCRFGQLVCAVKLREAPVLRRVDMRWAGICAPLCDTVSTTCQTTSTRISGNNNNQQPTNQPTNQPNNQPTKQTNQPTNQPTKQATNQPTNQTNQTTKQPNNQQPTTNKQQPTTNNQQTTTNNQQPTQQQLQLQLHT